jgi:hypothetical protein
MHAPKRPDKQWAELPTGKGETSSNLCGARFDTCLLEISDTQIGLVEISLRIPRRWPRKYRTPSSAHHRQLVYFSSAHSLVFERRGSYPILSCNVLMDSLADAANGRFSPATELEDNRRPDRKSQERYLLLGIACLSSKSRRSITQTMSGSPAATTATNTSPS